MDEISPEPRIKVTPTDRGAVITVGGYDIEITVKPSEEVRVEPPAPSQPWITVESVSADLSPYIDDLDIAEDEENIVVMPKRYLGRKRFSEIAELMRELGGNYVSAGKESKFLIPKREAETG